MPRPIFCYVTDRKSLTPITGSTSEAALIERIHDAAYAGVDWIQIREKDLDAGPLFDLVSAAMAAIRGSSVKVMVNDRLDVAWAAKANGVHLGESSLPVADVVRAKRRAGPDNFLVGVSCHSCEAAVKAASEGADYVYFGPVFATPSKKDFGEPQGLERLSAVCRNVSIPVIAIGGIDAENTRACLAAGSAGIAAIRLFQQGGSSSELSALLTKLR